MHDFNLNWRRLSYRSERQQQELEQASGASIDSVTLQRENSDLQQQLQERNQHLVRSAMKAGRSDKEVDAVKELAAELDRVRFMNDPKGIADQILKCMAQQDIW